MERVLTVSGVNGGKEFSIEKLNLEALVEIRKLKDLPKDDPIMVQRMVFCALLSSNSIDFRSPDYRKNLEMWSARMKADEADKVIDAFMEANADFLSGNLRAKLSEAKSQIPSTQSAPSTNSPSNTPPG